MRIGFIGAGGIAKVHAQRLIQIDGVKISSGVDVDITKAREFAETFGANFTNALRRWNVQKSGCHICVHTALL